MFQCASSASISSGSLDRSESVDCRSFNLGVGWGETVRPKEVSRLYRTAKLIGRLVWQPHEFKSATSKALPEDC